MKYADWLKARWFTIGVMLTFVIEACTHHLK